MQWFGVDPGRPAWLDGVEAALGALPEADARLEALGFVVGGAAGADPLILPSVRTGHPTFPVTAWHPGERIALDVAPDERGARGYGRAVAMLEIDATYLVLGRSGADHVKAARALEMVFGDPRSAANVAAKLPLRGVGLAEL